MDPSHRVTLRAIWDESRNRITKRAALSTKQDLKALTAMLAVDSRSTTVERAHAALRWPGLGNRL